MSREIRKVALESPGFSNKFFCGNPVISCVLDARMSHYLVMGIDRTKLKMHLRSFLMLVFCWYREKFHNSLREKSAFYSNILLQGLQINETHQTR